MPSAADIQELDRRKWYSGKLGQLFYSTRAIRCHSIYFPDKILARRLHHR